MELKEIENVLEQVFNAALNTDGLNYPVTIVLFNNMRFIGFKIIENSTDKIIGFTAEEKVAAITEPYYKATVIRKSFIKEICCPMLDAGRIQH